MVFQVHIKPAPYWAELMEGDGNDEYNDVDPFPNWQLTTRKLAITALEDVTYF